MASPGARAWRQIGHPAPMPDRPPIDAPIIANDYKRSKIGGKTPDGGGWGCAQSAPLYILYYMLSPFPLYPPCPFRRVMLQYSRCCGDSRAQRSFLFPPLPLRRFTHAEGGFFFLRGMRDGGIGYLWGIAEVGCLRLESVPFRSSCLLVALCTVRFFVKSRQTHEKGAVSALNVSDDRFIVWGKKAQEGAFSCESGEGRGKSGFAVQDFAFGYGVLRRCI